MIPLADIIQIAIFCAIVIYTWETHTLREWQQKQVQLTILNMEMDRRGKDAIIPSYYPKAVLEIYHDAYFDPNEMYSPIYRIPLNFVQKIKKFFHSSRQNTRR